MNTTLDIPRRDYHCDLNPLPPLVTALVLIWSRSEPHRVGEVTLLWRPGDDPRGRRDVEYALGRAGRTGGGGGLTLMRQRPGASEDTGALTASCVSRVQWRMRMTERSGLEVESVGRLPLWHNGAPIQHTFARHGDVLGMGDEALFMMVLRPPRLPATGLAREQLACEFGRPDEFGIIGESAAAWHHRRQLALAASRRDHVLLTGASGVGKELAARAIHGLSARRRQPLVARNAATLPESIIDAELFGSAKDYPNSGSPERPGLIGAADGSTLFLDEIGELSTSLQAHLLRVLDGGEYHRLGEARARKADVRVIAATNRAADELKHDLVPRLTLRLAVPSLEQRREDIPLIARAMLRRLCLADHHLAELAFEDGDLGAEPRWDASAIAALVTARYDGNVRELQSVLWHAATTTDGGPLSISPRPPVGEGSGPPMNPDVDPREVTADQLRDALERCGGSREKAWRALGLRNRHQIMRLLRKYEEDLTAPE